MKYKISIVMAVFNGEEYLRESLNSIFGQTYKDFELIIINDGSTDKTKDIILEYMSMDNVSILENKFNEGIPISRNRGLLSAKGEYIAIHDADDVSLPSRFAKQVHFLDINQHISVIGTHAIKINTKGQVVGSMVYPPKTTTEAREMIKSIKFNPIIDPSSMYRKDTILELGGYAMEEQWRTVSDFHLWCRLISHDLKISNIQERLIKYRINPNGLTRTKQSEMQQSTDLLCASFKIRNLPKIELRSDYFQQDNFTVIKNSK